ncbi:hypothetical protein [Flavobacterium selenitireducens]|uniref:hypothetical protein n=1 Tax=Flavobacterium selenitireducens TaxID=2722704 RepID=UPI00168AD347|nr:hypothetical protein [Flavobacterium selenitireducens]MBD3584103.1 hypothetical protein [Flavobacterium selenitireducens]
MRKVFREIQLGRVTLTLSEIAEIKTYSLEAFQEFGEPEEIDYSLDLIIHVLKYIETKNEFPKNSSDVYELVKSIADCICQYLQNNIEYLTKIDLIFEECPGRTAIVRKSYDDFYINLRGNNYKVYDIYQGYSIVDKDKNGNGLLIQHFEKGIYAKGEICMLEIVKRNSRHRQDDFIQYGKNIVYFEKRYPFEWKKDSNEFLITPEKSPVKCCEGRKSDKNCELSGKEFWWCYGRKCFNANQNYQESSSWKKYSLRDFIKILNLPFDENGYYIFVSEINRLNRLLERIKCVDCTKVLRPSKQTNFGFYRVSHFKCNDENCVSHSKEIYLTHCLNSKCTNVIDERVAKRCPNGFIICDICGSCCSNQQFVRRIENLESNGQKPPQKLVDLKSEEKGHWENAECFCYKCQNEMSEKGDNYYCPNCKVSYSRNNVYVKFFKGYQMAKNKKMQARQNSEKPPN